MPAPRILVADDDAWILRMVTTVLEKRGYVVETASDGEEALEKAIANRPDLVVTDVMMPNMDGWALIKALRSRAEFAFVPVIFLTALGSDDDRIRGFRLGADDYLPKPFRFEELDLRVAKTLKQSEMVEQMTRQRLTTNTEADEEKLEGSGLAGDLAQVGLSALLTLLEMERKSGILIIHDDKQDVTGRLFMREGQLLAARLDDMESPINEECVYQMLSWRSGTFEFNQSDVEMANEIQGSTTHLLLEGARRMDEMLA
jgi:DNA-binding response OmpR family regulator